jgi:uncharacterized glyoxalase superfamily protein PhnB
VIQNRSVPTDTVLPHVLYPDVAEAIAWLTKTFGFAEHYRYGDPVSGAQVTLGKACLMLKRGTGPAQTGHQTQCLTVFVDDVDSHLARATAAGAKIFEPLNETCYGERQYGVEDLAGHHWLFSQHIRNLSPSDWGATVAG